MDKTKVLIAVFCFLFLFASLASAQVQPSPVMPIQYFDNNGRPVSGGCLATFISGSSTPLATYKDALGSVLNTNPIQLDSAGRAYIFLTAAAYDLKLYYAGTTHNCATSLGPLLWTAVGLNPSANSVLASNNTWTGTNDFTASTIFDGAVTFSVGFTVAGPVNLNGGGSLTGTWTGSPIFSGTPNFSGGFLATTGTFSGQITSTVTTGTAPFVIASTTVVPNLNASLLGGCTWAIPCALGSTTPNAVTATHLIANTDFQLAGGTVQTGTQGTDTKLLTAGTISGTGAALCADANGGASTSGCTNTSRTCNANGCYMIQGGVITQWGQSAVPTFSCSNVCGTAGITFPITFPTAVESIHTDSNTCDSGSCGAGIHPISTTPELSSVSGFTIYFDGNGATINGSGVQAYWMAIGH